MTRLAPILCCLALAGSALALPAGAEPAPPKMAPDLTLQAVGIYCPPPVVGQEEAPGTAAGHVNLLDGIPQIDVPRQQVPAVLGIGFGLVYTPEIGHSNVRMEGWRPGRDQPDTWFTELPAGEVQSQGFTFETRDELVLGLWRFEAWDGDTLLYRAEFEVLPSDALPGVAMLCGLTS